MGTEPDMFKWLQYKEMGLFKMPAFSPLIVYFCQRFLFQVWIYLKDGASLKFGNFILFITVPHTQYGEIFSFSLA